MKWEIESSIVAALTEATRQGKIPWEPLADPDRYRYLGSLPDGTAVIVEAAEATAGLALGGGEMEPVLTRLGGSLEILDPQGSPVTRMSTGMPDLPDGLEEELRELLELVHDRGKGGRLEAIGVTLRKLTGT